MLIAISFLLMVAAGFFAAVPSRFEAARDSEDLKFELSNFAALA
ncbi:hypothetical protein [Cypionkella sp.]|nr:hypothetical protein [Cypionkella sp.]